MSQVDSKPAYFLGIHPALFRCGEVARIDGVELVGTRICYRLVFQDQTVDYSPILNSDFTGSGGEGYFYQILDEEGARQHGWK